jgi:hypothetical protein
MFLARQFVSWGLFFEERVLLLLGPKTFFFVKLPCALLIKYYAMKAYRGAETFW